MWKLCGGSDDGWHIGPLHLHRGTRQYKIGHLASLCCFAAAAGEKKLHVSVISRCCDIYVVGHMSA